MYLNSASDMKKRLNILIVEDQYFLAEDLAYQLSSHDIIGPYDKGEDVLANEQDVDLALLDIDLKGDVDGIQVAEWLNRKKTVPVIFITRIADDSKIYERVEGLGFPRFYLSKPFTPNELKIAMSNALQAMGEDVKDADTESVPDITLQNGKVLIRTHHGLEILDIEEDVLYVEANGENSHIITASGAELIVTSYLKVLLKRIAALSDCILRVHRSYAVNILKIGSIRDSKRNQTREKTIVLRGLKNKEIPLSQGYRKDLLDRFSKL